MAGISSSGLGSGLDINSLVSQLVAAEIQPQQTLLNTRQTRLQTQISALGNLKSLISTLNGSLQALQSGGALQKMQASSSDNGVLSVSAGSSASAGSYQVEVLSLAAAQKLGSSGFANAATTAVGTGTLSFSVNGSTFDVAIDSSHNTLNGIRDAINGATGNSGVNAAIVNADDGAHLVLTARQTGLANAITVTQSGGDGGLAALAYDPGNGVNALTQLNPAADASVKIDGYLHASASNTLTTAIDGLSLKLTEAQPGTPVTVTVSADAAGATSAIKSFVESYNNLVTGIAGMTAYDAEAKKAGALLGNAAVNAISQNLRRIVGSTASGAGSFDTLAKIGISSKADGTLTLDASKLSTALQSDIDDVSQLFSASDGIASRMGTAVSSFLGSDGVIQSGTDSANGGIRDVQKRLSALSQRSLQLQTTYLAQFNAMDALVSQLRSTSDFLTQQLAALPGFVTKSDNAA